MGGKRIHRKEFRMERYENTFEDVFIQDAIDVILNTNSNIIPFDTTGIITRKSNNGNAIYILEEK